MESAETQDLIVFVEVARAGSFGAAADQLLLSTPSVSARMTRLERKYSTQLFVRTPRGSRLTEPGRRFLSYAQRCLSLLHESHHAVRADSQRRLTVAVPASLGAVLFRPVLDVLRRVDVTADCRVAHSKEVVEHLLDGTATAGFMINTPAPSSLSSHRLMVSPLWAVARTGDALATAREIHLDDLGSRGVAIYRWGPEAMVLADAVDHPLRTKQNPVMLIGLPSTVLELVRDGYVGIVPAFSVAAGHGAERVARLPLQLPEWRLDITMVHRKDDDDDGVVALDRSLTAFSRLMTP
jgi:DNA-binding transcriptional LysR family regulator